MLSGGATPPWSPKKPAFMCSKLARMFLCETMTPAGVRVDPEVYWRYMVSVELSTRAAGAGFESRSSRSTSITDRLDSPDFDSTYSARLSATEDVVRTAEGDASRITALTRSSLAPPSGTAMKPACNAPRNAVM